MLSNEQCIEVAGKVWGCDLEGIKRFKPQIIHEVNSWQGFGRTVEAMADQYGSLQVFGGWVSFKRTLDKNYEVSDSFGLIEATHLAALEALK